MENFKPCFASKCKYECMHAGFKFFENPGMLLVGAIIDMKEGTIKYQFSFKKGMEHFLIKINKLLFDSILRANYDLDASLLEIT
jgi:hypothetical protein